MVVMVVVGSGEWDLGVASESVVLVVRGRGGCSRGAESRETRDGDMQGGPEADVF